MLCMPELVDWEPGNRARLRSTFCNPISGARDEPLLTRERFCRTQKTYASLVNRHRALRRNLVSKARSLLNQSSMDCITDTDERLDNYSPAVTTTVHSWAVSCLSIGFMMFATQALQPGPPISRTSAHRNPTVFCQPLQRHTGWRFRHGQVFLS